MSDKPSFQLSDFDISAGRIMALFLAQNTSQEELDDLIGLLHRMKVEHFTLEEKNRVLQKEVNLDTKTGLLKYNTKYLENIVKTVSRALDKKNGPSFDITYVRIDIDDFSVFNNKYGHDLGDDVLKALASLLKEKTRPTDFCIRFGGEEFDIMLPSTEVSGAKVVMTKLYDAIHNLKIPYNDTSLRVTVSSGVSYISYTPAELIKLNSEELHKCYTRLQQQADNALYEAKYLGKDQFCIFDEKKLDEYKNIRTKYISI